MVDKEVSVLNSQIDRLMDINSELTLRSDWLEHEVNALNNRLDGHQSLRSVIRLLFIRVDDSIEELIYPSKYRTEPELIPPAAKLTHHNDLIAQLTAINEYDQAYLTKIKIASRPVREYALKIYRTIKSWIVRIIKISLRVVKKAKRVARRR